MKNKSVLVICLFLIVIIIVGIIIRVRIRLDDEKIQTISVNIKNETGFDIKKIYMLNEYDEKDNEKETDDEEDVSGDNFFDEIEEEKWIELLGDDILKNGETKSIEMDMRKKGNGCEFVITKDEDNEYIMEETIGEDILQDNSNIIFTIENDFLLVNEAD